MTFSELIEQVRTSGLPSSRRRDIISAIRRYLTLIEAPADATKVSVPQIRHNLLEITPAKIEISRKTWSNLKSNLLAGIELAQIAPISKKAKVQLSESWLHLLLQISDRRTREGLSRFMRFCSRNDIAPAQANLIILEEFEAALREGSFVRRASTIKRDVATLWNRLVERLPEFVLTRLDLPSRRPEPTRVSRESLPCSFRHDLRTHLDWASGQDPFAQDARRRPLGKRSLRLREQYVLSAVTALVRSGVDCENIKALADLAAPAAFRSILRQRLNTQNPRSASYNEGLAKALIAIAVEWVRPDSKVIAELKRLKSRLPAAPPGLTEKNKAVLREFGDPEMMKRLLRLPQTLWAQAERRPFSFRTLAEYEAALAIAILTFAPLRVSNLAALEFGRTLQLPDRDHLSTLIDIPGPEMKAGQAYMIELPPALTKMLRIYYARLRGAYERKPRYVFENGNDRAKLASSLSWLIQRTLRRHLGVKMTAHQFRHIMADLVISDEPSASSFEMARQLLGHRNITTTTRFYTGQNTMRAGRRHHQLIEEKIAQAKSHIQVRRTKRNVG